MFLELFLIKNMDQADVSIVNYMIEQKLWRVILSLIQQYHDIFVRIINIPVHMSILHTLAKLDSKFDEDETELFTWCAKNTNTLVK